ncbi:MAG TPA: cytochrome ubiquinol oxidase subunit I, partial [Alphaproteobacteria bacterium]|nr:cytochrome ubiquinol oxidase subunit I [Alphaproteobacteria bacterium]
RIAGRVVDIRRCRPIWKRQRLPAGDGTRTVGAKRQEWSMAPDAAVLARSQFAFTISFHILFPTLTIGLAAFLVLLEALWLKSGRDVYRRLYHFWSRIFALTFGMGVVTGVVMSYQFGANFGPFSRAAGNVLGPLLTYEVLSAFFLEAGFLGIMLFGWNRVGRGLHFTATVLVALGTAFSAFWILSANSWMQTPAGYALEGGVFRVTDWWAVVFNPSFPYRFVHMLLASYLTAAFVVAGVGAWHLLRDAGARWARRMLRVALTIAAVLAPLQILAGDQHGLNVEEYQPLKVAAMEGRWQTMRGAPLLLFAWPDQQAGRNRFEVGIPYGASLILKHDPDGLVRGLNEAAPQDRPRVAVVFWAFRIMVGIGFLLLFVAWAGAWLGRGGRLPDRRFLRLVVLCSPLGFVATLSGWFVAEIGRQPWVVYGLMRTADAISPVPASSMASALVLFLAVYGVLFVAFLTYLFRVIARGPELGPMQPEEIAGQSRGVAGEAAE